MQDKISAIKITEIREERIANSFYPGSATSRAYVQSSRNPFEIFHYLFKLFTTFEHTMGSLTLVFKILKSPKTNSLLIIIVFLKCIEEISQFKGK